ncbi:MAG: hypothetical protein ABI072_05770 [Edaphobacter sp.]
MKEFSFRRQWPAYGLALLILLVPIAYGVSNTGNKAFPSNLGVYGQLMITPFIVIIPIGAVLLGCLPTFDAVGHRFIANTRSRIDIRALVGVKLIASAVIPFVAFTLLAFASFIIAFYIWPTLGNPGVLPNLYGLTEANVLEHELTDASYSSLLSLGQLPYGLIYSFWFGLGAATYSCLGVAALLVLNNRMLALATPFVIYFVETILANLTVGTKGALMYSLVPFGLNQSPILIAAAPQLLLVVGTIACWTVLFPKLPYMERTA